MRKCRPARLRILVKSPGRARQAGCVENEHDAAIAKFRGAADAGGLDYFVADRAYDDFPETENAVHRQPDGLDSFPSTRT